MLADQHNPQWEEQLGNQGNQQAGSLDNLQWLWVELDTHQVQVQAGSLDIHKEVAVPGIPQGRRGFVVEDMSQPGECGQVGMAAVAGEEEQMQAQYNHWIH